MELLFEFPHNLFQLIARSEQINFYILNRYFEYGNEVIQINQLQQIRYLEILRDEEEYQIFISSLILT